MKQYVIRKFVSVHTGHSPSHESYKNYRKNRLLTEEERKLYIEKYMMELDIPTRKVQQEIEKDTGKVPTGKNLRRSVEAVKKSQGKGTDMEELVKILENLKATDTNSTVQIAYADSDKQPFCAQGKKIIKIIFFQTGKMKRLFAKHGSVLSIDGTYNLCNNQYVLVPFHIIDNHLRTRVCGFSLLSNETSQVMRAALEMFEEANRGTTNNIRYLIVDKDFVEISAAGNVFCSAKIIICQWHAVKRVDSVIHKLSLASNKQHLKSDLMHLFRTMVNATSEEDYFAAWNSVIQRGQEHNEIEPFVKYLGSNWHVHRDLFATHRLQTYPLFMTFTNNRAENFNKQLKQVIKKQSPVTVVVKKAMEIAEKQEREAVRLDVKSRDQIFMPTDANDPTVIEALSEGRGLLSHETLQKLRNECEKVRDTPLGHLRKEKNAIKCTLSSDECNFSKNYELPCCHLLATRKNNGEPLLEEGMIGKQWKIDQPEALDKIQVCDTKHHLFVKKNETTRKAKFNTNMNTMKEMASAMAQFPEGERAGLIHQLELLMNAWNNGIQTKIDVDTIRFLLSPHKKESLTNDQEELDIKNLIFSPKKQNKLYSSSNETRKKRRELFPSAQKNENSRNARQWEENNTKNDKKDGLEDWQQEIVNRFKHDFGAGKQWRKTDFEKLSDANICGTAAYLNDTIFHYVLLLMKAQFPEIQGLQDTVDYKITGFRKIDPSKPFLQPVHSGALHWALLTNIPLNQTERQGNAVCLFDSMIRLSRQSDSQADIPSAIMWQVAQLYKKNNWKEAEPIDVHGMPCAQQENGHDCGMHVIMNLTALAFGYDPSKIVFKTNGRAELLDMIQKCTLRMFPFEEFDCDGPAQKKFTVMSQGRMQKRIFLKKTTTTLLPLCICQLPESWDNVVFCSQCNKMFHQACHFMGTPTRGRSIADTLPTFKCFSCREPGDYETLSCGSTKPDYEAIDQVVAKIDQLESHKLCAHYHKLIQVKRDAPKSLRDFQTLCGILAKYDLNTFASPRHGGLLYVSLKNFYNRHSPQLPERVQFDECSIIDQIYFAVSVICDIEQEECPPIWEKQRAIVIGEELGHIYNEKRMWSLSIDTATKDIEKKITELRKKNAPSRTQDLLSYLISGIRELKNSTENLNQTLAEVEVVNATKKQKEWRQETMQKCHNTIKQLVQFEGEVATVIF